MHSGISRPRRAAAGLAALVTAVMFCAADAVARSYPFGPRTRTVNDLGNQYVPFHAHLWDLLHGRADGGLLVNWQSGYGSSFLPDLGTYLTSPFALLVAVFPRDEIDLAVYVITVLKVACAAAAMAWLLLTLRPGRWWAAGLLGASYALCGWTVAAAVYNLMWLDGLIALPLLCLAGEWILHQRRPLLGVLVVAGAWIANFYTAYMATLAAGLVLLLRLALSGLPSRRKAAVAGRAGLTAALGTGLAAPLVTVIYFGTQHASPGRFTEFKPVGAEDLPARLLPTTYSFGSPALFVGTTALLLALALPFHRAAPRRVRAGWTLLVAGVTLSMQWDPTHLLWHAFAAPQGSPYRQAFVVCALLVTAAWHTLSYGVPAPRALGAATGLLALIVAVAARSDLVRQVAWPVLLLATAGALSGLVLLGRVSGRGGWRPLGDRSRRLLGGPRRTVPVALAAVLLLGAQFGETVATSAVASRLRLAHLDDYAPWGDRQRRQAEAIAQADGWPGYRTDPGREQTVANDPMLVGGQGAQYYSSHTSDVLFRTLTALGAGWTSGGRSPQSLDNAVTDAIFSVGARVHSPPDPHQSRYPEPAGRVTVSRQDVPPLVTVRPTAAPSPAFGPSPYRNQELLLGARVYTVPRLVVGAQTVTARCPAGSEAYLWAPHFSGTAQLTGAPGPAARFRSDASKRAAMQPLGTVPPSGRLTIALSAHRPGRIPVGAVGCLDTGRLGTVVQRLKTTGATKVTVSDGTIRAELPAGSKGIALVAAPRIAGWRCATGHSAAVPAGNYHGLISVPLDGTSNAFTCTFRPPGLRLGMTVGGVAFASILLLGVVGVVRRRRPRRPSVRPASRGDLAKIA
ncbi:YfhO family protein [Streptomyces sp. NPDC057280]|uniref:YfhO family protein n=1 Tax=Streptomyces sp. NPDC057280 TaxID=3346081 RepID=UPI00362E7242